MLLIWQNFSVVLLMVMSAWAWSLSLSALMPEGRLASIRVCYPSEDVHSAVGAARRRGKGSAGKPGKRLKREELEVRSSFRDTQICNLLC